MDKNLFFIDISLEKSPGIGGLKRLINLYKKFININIEDNDFDYIFLSITKPELFNGKNNKYLIFDYTLFKSISNFRFIRIPFKLRLSFYRKKIQKFFSSKKCMIYWNISGFCPILSDNNFVVSTLQDLFVLEKLPSFYKFKEIVEYKWFKRTLFNSIAYSNLIFVPVKYTITQINRVFGERCLNFKNIIVQPNPIDLSFFRPIKPEESTLKIKEFNLEHKKYILYLNTIQLKRGVEDLLRAYLILKKDAKIKDLKLVIAGNSNHPDFIIFKRKIENLNDHNIILLTDINDQIVPALYSSSLFYVYPTHECLSYTPLEATACSAPVIISDDPGLLELCNKKYFLISKRKDVNDLAKKMLIFINNPTLREKMKNEALRWVKRYDCNIICKETIDIIKDYFKEFKKFI